MNIKRAIISDTRIFGGRLYITEQERLLSSNIYNAEIFIDKFCLPETYGWCYFDRCVVYLYPDSPGMKAFNDCFFKENCRFIGDK